MPTSLLQISCVINAVYEYISESDDNTSDTSMFEEPGYEDMNDIATNEKEKPRKDLKFNPDKSLDHTPSPLLELVKVKCSRLNVFRGNKRVNTEQLPVNGRCNVVPQSAKVGYRSKRRVPEVPMGDNNADVRPPRRNVPQNYIMNETAAEGNHRFV